MMSHLLKATQVVGVLEFSAGQFDYSHGTAFTVFCVVFFSDVKVRAVLLFCFELGLRLASDSLCSCRWLKLVISCLHLPILGFQVCGITSAVLGINPRLCACCASTSPTEPHPSPQTSLAAVLSETSEDQLSPQPNSSGRAWPDWVGGIALSQPCLLL